MHYYMFNKPKGCVTARSDSTNPTVMDYFPEELRSILHPAGRLDKDTEGFLIMTDDGMLTHSLMRPEKHVSKTYFFYAIGSLDGDKISEINNGVTLQGMDRPVRPAEIEVIKKGRITEIADLIPEKKRESYLKNPMQEIFSGRITIVEGRNHQVKRMLRSIGCLCVYLKRTAIGGVSLDNSLGSGKYRPLTDDELDTLRNRQE